MEMSWFLYIYSKEFILFTPFQNPNKKVKYTFRVVLLDNSKM
jgi:hypothetical protein